MNGTRDYYYMALGLRPGAPPSEIKAAYRRLLKLYHPDQDASLDAEVRYKEIREAYAALIQEPAQQPQAGAPKRGYTTQGTVYGNDWRYTDTAEDEEDDAPNFDFSDLIGEEMGGPLPRKKKRLFPWPWNMAKIFQVSFKEVFGLGMLFRVFLTSVWLSVTLTWVGWGGLWKAATILCILLCGLLYRYYFTCLPRRLPIANVVGSILFGIALSWLCASTTHQTYVVHWSGSARYGPYVPHYEYGSDAIAGALFWEIYIELYLLWGNPFGWGIWKHMNVLGRNIR